MSTMLGAEVCIVGGLGAGKREPVLLMLDAPAPPWGKRGWIEPVELRTVLKLMDEPMEKPELYDFRLGSGVVLEEDGVEVFRGSISVS